MIFQEYALFRWLTVCSNVEFGVSLRGTDDAERRRVAEQYQTLVGLKVLRMPTRQLSGGMRQPSQSRVVANDPEVVLMDEPLAALDAMTRQLLQDELLRVVEASGKTAIFVTHSIDEALIHGARNRKNEDTCRSLGMQPIYAK